MNRRDAIKATAATLWLTSSGVLAACARAERGTAHAGALGADDQALAEEIADTLLPATPSSPGAKAAGAGAAMQLLLTDCYDAAAQRRVVAGLESFRASCRAKTGSDFAALPRPRREQLLREISAEAKAAGETHYFGLVRELANRAYFSSEIGMTRALRWIQTPGRWNGCIPLAPGQPAWG